MLRVGALRGFRSERGLHHEPHLSEFLKGGIVQEEEEFHRHSEDGGGVLVEVTTVADFLGYDAHDLGR